MTAPDDITSLGLGQVMVFGSNGDGEHAGGAARYAYDNFGAEWGNHQGIQGQSYAIPTMAKYRKGVRKSYSLHTISLNVQTFLYYARQHPELTFMLTRIACGIAGHGEEDIAPMFHAAPDNVWKPRGW